MLNSELLSTAWPYINFFLSAIVARLVAMRRSFLRGKPPTLEKRKADADICAIGSFVICWASWIYFPERFDYQLSVFVGFCVGYLSMSKVYDIATKKFGADGHDKPPFNNS